MIETQEFGLTQVVLCHTSKECGETRGCGPAPRPPVHSQPWRPAQSPVDGRSDEISKQHFPKKLFRLFVINIVINCFDDIVNLPSYLLPMSPPSPQR